MIPSLARLFEDARYQNYAANRDACPETPVQSWRKVYGPEVDEWEAKYQAEKVINRARFA